MAGQEQIYPRRSFHSFSNVRIVRQHDTGHVFGNAAEGLFKQHIVLPQVTHARDANLRLGTNAAGESIGAQEHAAIIDQRNPNGREGVTASRRAFPMVMVSQHRHGAESASPLPASSFQPQSHR